MRLFSVLVFFLTFYRISVGALYLYPSILFGGLGILLLLKRSVFQYFLRSLRGVLAILSVMILYSLAGDYFSGALFQNTSNAFSVRMLSIIAISLSSALLLSCYLLKGDREEALKIIEYAFWLQIVFWVLTFLDPSIKFMISEFMGGSNVVNLRDYNLSVRGFGISNEMNFTSPFMTVLVSLLLLRKKAVSIVSTITQIINSNLVAIAILLGLLFSKMTLAVKLFLVAFALTVIYVFGEAMFPRLFDEFSGMESRTVLILLERHLFILNSSLFEHFFGTFQYVFQGGSRVSSDVGWVHLYNYGGIVFTIFFILLLALLCLRSFGSNKTALVWFIAGIVLNTKGQLLSPNSYFFVSFLFLFLRCGSPKTVSVDNSNLSK